MLDRSGIKEEGMGGLEAVSQGSAEEPRFIVLEHKGSDDPPVVLVGKGVTFDTGGISLKPPANMEEMKFDMSGAAAVLGAFEAIGRLQPRDTGITRARGAGEGVVIATRRSHERCSRRSRHVCAHRDLHRSRERSSGRHGSQR